MESILLYDWLFQGVASAAYAALAVHFWRTRWRAAPARAGEEPVSRMQGWERAALLVPLALHGALLWRELFAAAELHFGFAYALSAMLWIGVLIYWVESLFLRLEGFEPLLLPLAAVAVPLPAMFPGHAAAYAASIGFRVHLGLAMLAYSLFTIAMLHALLMTLIERRLHRLREAPPEHRAPLAGPLAHLPPLLTLERLLFRIIGIAFVLLTLTLATGIGFSESLFGRPLKFDHKTLFAIVSWLTFALLLAGRFLRGWRGRTALRWTLAGFVMLLLAYVGSRFVLEVLLGRS
jgi:ABC-type uncharacterized transport system permease subunit